MRDKRRGGSWLRPLRRGIGLGLALAVGWCVSLTADLSGAWSALQRWMSESQAAVTLMAKELGQPPEDAVLAGLDGWGRLLVEQSALLSAGTGAVAQRRQITENSESTSDSPSTLEEPDNDDQTEPNLQPPAEPDDVIETTSLGKEGEHYLSQDGVYLYDRTGKELDPSVFSAGSVSFTLGEGPQILILHSHGSEAYSQNDGDLYQESDPFRTTDCTHNVVRVGEEMAEVFRSHGFQVVHDTTLYDYPAYNGAYDRSHAAVEDWLAKYPTIRIILDVHRDALVGTDGAIYKLVSQENETKAAQIMLVVGTDAGGAGHPNWTDNLALAIRLQQELVGDYISLARPIALRSSSYNQELSPGSLLVEVGGARQHPHRGAGRSPPLRRERQPGTQRDAGIEMDSISPGIGKCTEAGPAPARKNRPCGLYPQGLFPFS